MPKRDEGALAQRATYKAFHMVSTRWADNDVYGTDYCIGFSTCVTRTIERDYDDFLPAVNLATQAGSCGAVGPGNGCAGGLNVFAIAGFLIDTHVEKPPVSS